MSTPTGSTESHWIGKPGVLGVVIHPPTLVDLRRAITSATIITTTTSASDALFAGDEVRPGIGPE